MEITYTDDENDHNAQEGTKLTLISDIPYNDDDVQESGGAKLALVSEIENIWQTSSIRTDSSFKYPDEQVDMDNSFKALRESVEDGEFNNKLDGFRDLMVDLNIIGKAISVLADKM